MKKLNRSTKEFAHTLRVSCEEAAGVYLEPPPGQPPAAAPAVAYGGVAALADVRPGPSVPSPPPS